MNQVIIEKELIGKEEDELLSLFVDVAAELARMHPKQPTYRVTEASLDTIKQVMLHARNRAASRHRQMAL